MVFKVTSAPSPTVFQTVFHVEQKERQIKTIERENQRKSIVLWFYGLKNACLWIYYPGSYSRASRRLGRRRYSELRTKEPEKNYSPMVLWSKKNA